MVFSSTTMASSTSRPITSARPPSVMTLTECPVKYRPMNPARTDRGIARVMMSVERTEPRKRRIIRAASSTPRPASWINDRIASRT